MGIIKYYPLSRVKTNLKTSGRDYTLNGKPYSGAYYLTYTGEAFTGVNPATGPNEPLEILNAKVLRRTQPVYNSILKIPNKRSSAEDQTKAVMPAQQQLKQIVPHYPVILESDYAQGHFTRYFAKKVNMNSYIMEISYEDWGLISDDTDNTYEDYEVLDMFWQLTGPLNDKRVSQYQIIGGVYDTNKRITQNSAKGFNGLVEYVGGDYTKYARITPDPTTP